jgi:hypothetical protein
MNARQPYSKPVVMQLHYSTEPGVAIASPCKTTGSLSGPTVEPCKQDGSSLPCVTPES